MDYISTRGQDGPLRFEQALLSGLARDGGLYLPVEWPRFSKAEIAAMKGLSYAELAGRIMAPFCDGEISEAELTAMADCICQQNGRDLPRLISAQCRGCPMPSWLAGLWHHFVMARLMRPN